MFKTFTELKKKNIPWALAFFVLKIRKIIQIIYQNNVVEKTCLFYRRRRKKHYVLIKDFNRFVHDRFFCRYCLRTFITEEILRRHSKDCLKLVVNKRLRCLRKVNIINSKIFGEKNHHS